MKPQMIVKKTLSVLLVAVFVLSSTGGFGIKALASITDFIKPAEVVDAGGEYVLNPELVLANSSKTSWPIVYTNEHGVSFCSVYFYLKDSISKEAISNAKVVLCSAHAYAEQDLVINNGIGRYVYRDEFSKYYGSYGSAGAGGYGLTMYASAPREIEVSIECVGYQPLRTVITPDTGTVYLERLKYTKELDFNVVDANTLESVYGARIELSGDNLTNDIVLNTDANGIAKIVLPQGTYYANVSKSSYISRTFKINVKEDTERIPKFGISTKPLVEAGFNVKSMTIEEIKNAGINVTAASNQHVYRYEVKFDFLPDNYGLQFYFDNSGKYIGYSGSTGDINPGNGGGTGGTGGTVIDGPSYPGTGFTGGSSMEPIVIPGEKPGTFVSIYPMSEHYYLIIHGQAKWLKEMFHVEMYVLNNSLTDTFEDCVASITLPDGLSLAEMVDEAGKQSLTQKIDYIPEGGTHKFHWYVRGDKVGEYNISGSLKGKLMPFEEEVDYSFELESPIKVYAGEAMHMTIYAPEAAYFGENYDIRIEIENVSDRPIYGFTNTILGLEQCKVTTYKNKEIHKETYLKDRIEQSQVIDVFEPGDKIVIEVSSKILFESEIFKNMVSGFVKQVDDIEMLVNSLKASADASQAILRTDEYIKALKVMLADEISKAEDAERKQALEALDASVDKLYEKLSLSDDYAIDLICKLRLSDYYDDLSRYATGLTKLSWVKNERLLAVAEGFSKVADSQGEIDSSVFSNLRYSVQALPWRFILQNVLVTTLSGSTTEIPYSVIVTPDTSNLNNRVTQISNKMKDIIFECTGAIDGYTVSSIYNNGLDSEKQTVKFSDNINLNFTAVSENTSIRAWAEDENGKVITSMKLSSSCKDAKFKKGVLEFSGGGLIVVEKGNVDNGVLVFETTDKNGKNTVKNKVEYDFEIVQEHDCCSDEWLEIIQSYYAADGYSVKLCDMCGDIIDVKSHEESNEMILTIGQKEAEVFGENKTNDVAPIIVKDRTMLSARFVAENLGAEVFWDSAERKVTIVKDEIEIILVIDSDEATVNGETVLLDSPAFIDNNRTYTPVRFVAESLNANVDWRQATGQVVISQK